MRVLLLFIILALLEGARAQVECVCSEPNCDCSPRCDTNITNTHEKIYEGGFIVVVGKEANGAICPGECIRRCKRFKGCRFAVWTDAKGCELVRSGWITRELPKPPGLRVFRVKR